MHMDTRTHLGRLFGNIFFTIRPQMRALEALLADSDAECQYASFWIGQGDGWRDPEVIFSRYVRKKGSGERGKKQSNK